MSHHAQLSPEAIQKLQAQKRNSTISAIIIALLLSALIVAVLFFIALSPLFKNEEELVSYSPGSENFEDITQPEITSEVEKKPSSPSASMSKVIVANAPSPTAIPVPKNTAVEPSLDFGSSNDFGDGWGGSGFGDGSSGGGGKSTPFGNTGGAGLKGLFYDLKQDREKQPTKLAKEYGEGTGTEAKIKAYAKEIAKLNRSRYSASSLKDIFKADVELTFSHLVIPNSRATIAPKAFNVEKDVDPAGWVIVYEGILAQDAPNRVRFTGRFDDLLIVQINNRVVFEGSWTDYTGKLNEKNQIPGPRMIGRPMIKADRYIELEKGDSIRIIIGESPGGHLGGGLFVAEKGVEYKKNDAGQDILPPFTTQALTSEDIDRLKSIDYPKNYNLNYHI